MPKINGDTHRWTKTTSFLIPACGLDVSILFEHGFINAYLDDEGHDKSPSKEEDIFLLFNPDDFESDFEILCEVLRNHPNFLEEYDPSEGHVIIRFKLNEKWKHIKGELLTNKYSQIDRKYVKEFYNPKVVVGEDMYGNLLFMDSVNYQILTKSSVLRDKWEKRLGISFKDRYEVCSKLIAEEEIYRKQKSKEEFGQQTV